MVRLGINAGIHSKYNYALTTAAISVLTELWVHEDVLGIPTTVIYLTGIKIVLLDSWKVTSSRTKIFRSRIIRQIQSVYCKHNFLETDQRNRPNHSHKTPTRIKS